MSDYLTLGPTPCDEECAAVGTEGYYDRMKKEAAAYIHQLIRMFGEPPFGARLRNKSFDHDMGTYHEVCVIFDDEYEDAVDYAFKLESEIPLKWDDKAKLELADLRIGTHW